MRIRGRSALAAQEFSDVLRQARIAARCSEAKAHRLAVADGINRERAAARYRMLRDDEHVEQELDAVLRQEQPRQIPDDRALAVFDVAARHRLCIAEVD